MLLPPLLYTFFFLQNGFENLYFIYRNSGVFKGLYKENNRKELININLYQSRSKVYLSTKEYLKAIENKEDN